ncbi:hypothetical protein PC129_g23261 [Phytophthora cactorum]|uniref:CCHC-type domain-containing protein n=1 Tax=Phytophthora cactorum TaxID=29920 RepID=A0A8T1H0T3_9STRA|nr:hypothetical protein PC114_g1536 [Phytophthora cactorum]KAG2999290.1 hypothetical protein PC118_g892 [Phytophthora cactorum]KAG3041510.1 hypothetical protein PC119_g719 [Phytophthora cactorum]KAG3202371.1 hypothetical protein PC129_g23261 [Phytophthora cactorum]
MMLRTLPSAEQHSVALGFIVKKQRDAAAAMTTTASSGTTPRVQSLKLHVSSYVRKEGEPLLQWLVEVGTAIAARRIFDDPSKVAFAVSCLGGRASEELGVWTPDHGRYVLRHQGKHDVHAYAQRARYLVSNIVTNSIDEVIKVVTFMKGLRDGPVKTCLFREYPSTLEAAITLAMQEEFSLRQTKLHVNVPRMARPVIRAGGPEAMDLSNATAAGHQQRNNSSVRCFRCGYTGHFARECTAAVHKAGGRRGDAGHRRDQPKQRAEQVGAGRPTGSAVTRVYNGHATPKTVAPSERDYHYKKQDDKPNLAILKIRSKRENSLRALVDSGTSNNFVRQQSLPKLNFEDVDTPRSALEVRLATGATVRTEKRVVRVRFSYKHGVFVENLIVLDLDDKFYLVLGMPWLARHDPVVNWEKRTVVRFGRNTTESDGPVSVAHAPQGAPDHFVEAAPIAVVSGAQAQVATTERVVECELNQNPVGSDVRRVSTSGGRDVDGASTPGVDPSDSEGFPVTDRVCDDGVSVPGTDASSMQRTPATSSSCEVGVSAPGVDTALIGSKITEGSAERRRGVNSASTPGVDDAASSVGGCKRPTPGKLAGSRAAGLHDEAKCIQAGLDYARPRKESADGYEINGNPSKSGLGRGTSGAGLHKKKIRCKRHKLRKSWSGTETLQEMSAGQISDTTSSAETLIVLTRTRTGIQYRSMQLENPPTSASELTSLPVMSWMRFMKDLYDGRIEQICILLDLER